MDPNELMRLLDLDTDSTEPDVEFVQADEIANQEIKEVTDTVIAVDEWDVQRGQDLAERRNDVDSHAMADFHAAAFMLDPAADGNCHDKLRQQFVETLLETPEYKILHNSTRSNMLASAMAANQFADQFAALAAEQKQKQEQGQGEPGGEGSEIATVAAVGAAVDGAQKDVDKLEGMMRGIGMDGMDPGAMDPQQVMQYYNRVKSNRQLQRIIELAGRFRMAAQAAQRQKVTHGYDDMVGVELSGDVGRLVPSELAQFADELFELNAARRLIENQSMSREHEGVEPQAKGPIVVCIDESGSMDGERMAQAKAFALAMAWIAKKQNRYCCLVSYSSGDKLDSYVVLHPGKWDQVKVMDWLSNKLGGGTNLNVPCKAVPDNWEKLGCPKGKTDMIIVTDGLVSCGPALRKSFQEWKDKEQVKLISIVLGTETGVLGEMSDEAHCVASFSVTEGGMQASLSI